MTKELQKQIVIRNALYWAAAMILPVTVMIVLDLFDMHTPSRVALWSSLFMLVPFRLANSYLARELGRLIPEAKDPV